MAEKLAFTLKVTDEGSEDTIKKINDSIKKLKKELSTTTINSDAYKELDDQIGKAKARLKELGKTSAAVSKQMGNMSFPEGSLKDLQARISETKNALSLLDAEGRKSSFGQALKKQADELEKALQEVQDEIGETERKASKLGDLVGRVFGKNVGLAVNTASKSLGGLGKTIQGFAVGAAAFAAVAVAAVAAGAAVVNFSNEYEDASDTVQKYSKANGEALDKQTQEVLATSKTFEVSAEQISGAAEQLALETGTSFNDALARIQKGLVSGQKDNEKYLQDIADTPSLFKDASDAVTEYSLKKEKDLKASRELAQAQSELVKKFEPLKTLFTDLSNFILPLLVKGLGYVVDAFTGWIGTAQKVAATIGSIGQAISDFVGISSQAQRDAYDQAVQRENAFLKEREALRQSFSSKLTKIYGKDFVDQLTAEQSLAFEFAFINAQSAAEAAGKDTATAFDEGFSAGVQNLAATGADMTTLAQKQAAAATQQMTEEAKKAAEERAKERKKEQADYAKERAEFIKNDVKKQSEYLSILLSLERESVNLRAELIKDDFEKQKVQSQLSYQQAKEDRANAQAEQVKQLEDEQKEFADKVGKNSKETIARAKQTRELIAQINKEYADIEVSAAQLQADEQKQIEKDKNEFILNSKLELARKTLENTQAINSQIAEQEALDNENFILNLKKQGLSESKASVTEAQLRFAALKRQREKFNQEEAQIALLGLNVDKELSKERLAEKKRLDNDILAAELDLHGKTEAARKEDLAKEEEYQKKKKESWLSTFETIAGFAQQGLDILTQAQAQIDDADQKRLDKEAERSSKRVETLRQELVGASALRTEFLNQQIAQEVETQRKIEAEKEALETERKKRAKQSALIEAGINIAVGVTKAFATQGILAGIAVSIAGAAQLAAIAAKEFADGGLVKNGKTGIYDLGSGAGKLKGKVQQNAPATQRGDKVLAYLNDDETVLNKRHVQKIGYNVLARAGVPGYTSGGMVAKNMGSLPAPRVPQSSPTIVQTGNNMSAEDLASVINQTMDARFKNIGVTLSVNELSRVTQDLANVKASRNLK
jgi:myosin heavy subunit